MTYLRRLLRWFRFTPRVALPDTAHEAMEVARSQQRLLARATALGAQVDVVTRRSVYAAND